MLAILAGIAAGLDAYLTSTSQHGYYPQDARWVVTGTNFPLAWKGIMRSDAITAIQRECPFPFNELESAVHRAIGFRPSPMRWRIWMGSRLLVAGAEQGTGVCIRPGILLRTAHLIRRYALGIQGEDGIYPYRELYYVWHEGFLIVSCSQDYLVAATAARPPPLEASETSDELCLHWRGTHPATLHIRGADGIPVKGWIEAPLHQRTQKSARACTWPEPPLMSISVSGWEDLQTLYTVLDDPLRGQPAWDFLTTFSRTVWNRWDLGELPIDWQQHVDRCTLAITEVQTHDSFPIPVVAVVLRDKDNTGATHPLQALTAHTDNIPADWNGQAGLIAPILGEGIALCLGRKDSDWIATTQEPIMARLAAALSHSNHEAADLILRLDWGKLGLVVEDLGKKPYALDLLPYSIRHTRKQGLTQWAQAFRHLGALRISGEVGSGRVVLEGFLAQQNNLSGDTP